MDTTTYVVCGFHQGRKLKPQYFSSEAQARHHALILRTSVNCVVLERTVTQLDHQSLDAVREAPISSGEPALA